MLLRCESLKPPMSQLGSWPFSNIAAQIGDIDKAIRYGMRHCSWTWRTWEVT
jgi:hypothetical protein